MNNNHSQNFRYLRLMYRLFLFTAILRITIYALTPGMLQRKRELRKQREEHEKPDEKRNFNKNRTDSHDHDGLTILYWAAMAGVLTYIGNTYYATRRIEKSYKHDKEDKDAKPKNN